MTRYWRAALGLVLVVATAACKEEAKADPGADQATVARVVLQRGDLPEEWVRTALDPSDPVTGQVHGCLIPQGIAPNVTHASDRYATSWSRVAYADASIWPSAAAAHSTLVSLTTDSFDVCATDAIKHYLSTTNIKFVSSTRVDVPVAQRGDGAVRYARTFVIDGGDGKRSTTTLDVFRVRRGRLTITCVLVGPEAPLTDLTARDLMDVMLNRVKL